MSSAAVHKGLNDQLDPNADHVIMICEATPAADQFAQYLKDHQIRISRIRPEDHEFERSQWPTTLAIIYYQLDNIQDAVFWNNRSKNWTGLQYALRCAILPESQLDQLPALLDSGIEDYLPAEFSPAFIHAKMLGMRQRRARMRQVQQQRELTESHLHLSLEAAHIGIWDLNLITEQCEINATWQTMLGYEPGEIQTSDGFWRSLVHPNDLPAARESFEQHMAGETPFYTVDYRMRHKDGHWHWIRDQGMIVAYDDKDQPTRVIGVHIDLNEHMLLQEKLRRYETNKYLQIVEQANEMIWMTDPIGNIVFANAQAVEHVGMSLPEQLRLKNVDLVHPEDRPLVEEAIERRAEGKREQYEVRLLRANGKHSWVLISVSAMIDEDGEYQGAIAMATDITERRAIEEKLKHDAMHDALTGLPNRSLLMDHMQMSIARTHRHHSMFAVLFIDLDRFKLLNDSMGHNAGDLLLKEVAKRLKTAVRPSDTVSRLGGDEFVLLLDDITEERMAVNVAERIQQALAEPVEFEGNQIFAYASIGIVVARGDYDEAEAILRDADTAMYRSKEYGKPYEFFNHDMHEEVVDRLELENELQTAITSKQFVIHYQPIVEIDSGQIVGLEALLRWDHPRRGLLAPDTFIPVLDDSGMIVPVGYWVLEEACSKLKQWNDEQIAGRDLWMNINLSARQFSQIDLTERIDDIFEKTGVDPKQLSFELTESAVMNESDDLIDKMQYLKDLGVKLSLDDFGTGYSSFARLAYLPFDSLKMDKTFIDDIGQNKLKKFGFINSIIMLAKALGLKVVGEGIETLEQQILLIDMGCDYGQGFLFSYPIAPEEVPGLFETDSLNPRIKRLD